ncbi:ECF transporter S component [Cryptobacterium curtum]|uniref:ECF transporter S component n=1 Tax=Cryptobacterium curtum TaxID=84163 RepID=UPI00248E4364|nr:ECF transporter S component [Cryptobacterium curtum]
MRTRWIAKVVILCLVPVGLGACAWFQWDASALLSFVVAVAAIVLFFVDFETSKPALRQIMPTVVLAALAAAGRILFAPIPDVKPVSAICILAGAVFGRRCGFMTGALAALVSNFFFGQGAWTPWQMYSWGLVGYLAGVLSAQGWLDHKPILYTYSFLSALVFGLIMNGWYVIGFVHPLTWESVLLAYAAGFPFDVIHGVATVGFTAIIYCPWKQKLVRMREKYALSGSA